MSFRTLPNFEWGLTHAIMFGGAGNSNYTWAGFLGRATAFDTGSTSSGKYPLGGGHLSQVSVSASARFGFVCADLGRDNLTTEARPIGGALPFLSVSYEGGYYLPRLTKDGRTDFRFEWNINEPNYETHSDALYWAYSDRLMEDPLGPNASEIDFQVGRWFQNLTKGSWDLFFYGSRSQNQRKYQFVPAIYGPTSTLHHERSVGMSFDLLTIPQNLRLRSDVFVFGRTHLAIEYCDHMNFAPPGAYRAVASITVGIKPNWDGWSWTK